MLTKGPFLQYIRDHLDECDPTFLVTLAGRIEGNIEEITETTLSEIKEIGEHADVLAKMYIDADMDDEALEHACTAIRMLYKAKEINRRLTYEKKFEEEDGYAD